MHVRRIAEADWELARDLRSRALRDSLDAFAATYDDDHAVKIATRPSTLVRDALPDAA